MSTKTSTKNPTKAAIQNHMIDDLRTVYLLAFTQGAIVPTDITVDTQDRINPRYARELLAVLANEGLISLLPDLDEDMWETTTVSVDENDLTEAEDAFQVWLDSKDLIKTVPTTVATKTKTATSTKTATPKNATGKCLCGCDENTAKSNYRPGHDARHAGQVARYIAANFTTKGFDRRESLAALPSDALKAKAEAMAERITAKADAKKRTTEPEIVTAKVGRVQYTGTVVDGEFHYADRKGENKVAAKFTLV